MYGWRAALHAYRLVTNILDPVTAHVMLRQEEKSVMCSQLMAAHRSTACEVAPEKISAAAPVAATACADLCICAEGTYYYLDDA